MDHDHKTPYFETESTETSVAVLKQQMGVIERDLEEIRKTMVNRDQFQPIKLIVYGIVATALSAVLAGLLALIINSSPMHKTSDLILPDNKNTITQSH